MAARTSARPSVSCPACTAIRWVVLRPLPVPFPPSPKVLGRSFSKILQRQAHSVADCLGIGFFGEILQMLIILLVAQPYDQAYALVNSIAVPMTIANSLGLALFMYIIKAGLYQRTQQKANQSQNILSIARETVRYFRKGLNPDSANAVVQIIKKHSPYDAVSITDTKQVLAYIGAESNHHAPGMNDHLTHVTIDSLTSGTIHIAYSPAEIGCTTNCTLSSAIVVPLMIKTRIIGTLKMYYTSPSYHPDSSDIAFAQGLADLFSTQLELTEIDYQRRLTEAAKMQALHTQINPHFLFNTLNTISSLIRTNPELASVCSSNSRKFSVLPCSIRAALLCLKKNGLRSAVFLKLPLPATAISYS